MNKVKPRAVLSAIFAVCMTAAFCIPIGYMSVSTLTKEKESYSYYENRLLAEEPEYTTDGLLSGALMNDIETYIKDHATLRDSIVGIYTAMNLDILKRPVVNGVVITDDALLPYNAPERVSDDEIAEAADKTAANLRLHSEEVGAYGGYFCYVAVPCQYVFFEDSYPTYLGNRSEYTAASSAALFSRLDSCGVNYIDMKAVFDSLGARPEFSSTVDNHYGIIGVYETYRAIMNNIIEGSPFRPYVLTEESSTLTTLPNDYLGSRSRKLLGMRGGNEKLSIIEPINNIPFDRYDNDNTDPIHIVYNIPSDPNERVLYELYMSGDVAKTVIETDRPELPSILIYGDSFTNPVECIAYTGFDTMYSYDFRHYDEMSLSEIIEEYKPDAVVCIRDYEAMLNYESNGC